MDSVLNLYISIFANYWSVDEPKKIKLLTWLTSAKYAKEVAKIRATEDKATRDKLKAKLPAATISGIFSKRCKTGLFQHSGLIAIDIDGKDNEHIGNFDDLKAELCKVKNVAYCGLSVSGRGYFVIIPIAYPERHEQHFDALKEDFAKFRIVIDDSCRNVDRLRGYSYDPDAYFNHHATPYHRYVQPAPQSYTPLYTTAPIGSEADKVEAILKQIEINRIDITGSYQTWRDIGFALANEFGQAGRDYFHRASQFHSKYNFQETDKQFNKGLKGKGGKTIATFYKIAEEYGITYKNALRGSQKPVAAKK